MTTGSTLKLCIANSETNQELAAVMQASFAEAGIEVEPEFLDPANYFDITTGRMLVRLLEGRLPTKNRPQRSHLPKQ